MPNSDESTGAAAIPLPTAEVLAEAVAAVMGNSSQHEQAPALPNDQSDVATSLDDIQDMFNSSQGLMARLAAAEARAFEGPNSQQPDSDQ